VRFSAASLRAVLEANLPAGVTGLVVGVSGGMDSACLATALAELSPPLAGLPLRAVHVDHGMQVAAGEFRLAASALCRKLGMPLDIIEVTVAGGAGVSLEAAAREARYRGLARQLQRGECLLSAHHAADQAETLLLQLLRGAGPKGLSAMPLCRSFGVGWQMRPLLATSKRELLRFAAESGVASVSDPMNHDRRFDRAFLRAEVWPLIERRWPGATTALARAASHLADAQAMVDQSASLAVQKLADGEALSVTGLRVLPPVERRHALRYWLIAAGVTPPSTALLEEALRQIIDADDDHLPAVVWGEHALRRYRDRVFLTPAVPPCVGAPRSWPVGVDSCMALGEGLGTLRLVPRSGGLDAARLPAAVTVRRRQGGESLKPHRLARTQSVQHLCQAHGVLPWMRDALPLLFAGESLLAIGDLWHDARWCVPPGARGLTVVWQDAPLLV
jgi:tRNA(Ile)-lysidine synthase